jgi:hypothetical protein
MNGRLRLSLVSPSKSLIPLLLRGPLFVLLPIVGMVGPIGVLVVVLVLPLLDIEYKPPRICPPVVNPLVMNMKLVPLITVVLGLEMILSHGANVLFSILSVVKDSKPDLLITVPVEKLVAVVICLFVDLLLQRKLNLVIILIFVVNLLDNLIPLLVRL